MAKNAVSYGLQSGAELTTKKFQLTFSDWPSPADADGKIESSRHWWRINVYNILAAIGAAQALAI